MILGAQMYTVSPFCKDLNGFSESLKKIADIGYKTVQVSGTCAYEPEWLRDELKKNGLKCVLTHIPISRLTDETVQVAKDHDVFDCKYVGLGCYGFNENQIYEEFGPTFKPVATKLKEYGKYFMYHNHDREFQKIGNVAILDKLAEDFAADEMGFTLDTFWIQAGGADPAKYVEMFKGRVPCIHLKDFAFGKKMAVVGEGNLNFDRILSAAEGSGTEYLIVEQDDCYGENPFECLKRSYQNLRAMGIKE